MMNRRDFLNDCALSVAAGSAISPLEALAQGALSPYSLPADYYPPTAVAKSRRSAPQRAIFVDR